MTDNTPEYDDIIEMTDDEYMTLREAELKDRDVSKYGGEFITEVWRRTYEYREIKYDIAMLRYVDTAGNIGMNRCGKWFVLEHPEETTRIARLVEEVNYYTDFLYSDTLHFWNNDQSLVEMFYEMVDQGKKDIDWFLNDAHSGLEFTGGY